MNLEKSPCRGRKRILPLAKLDGPGRPKRGITRQFNTKLEYLETKHLLKEVELTGITISQYLQNLVREDRILKSGKVN